MFIQTDSALDSIIAHLGAGPSEIRFDGRIHRFKTDKSRDNGWYIAHLTPTGPVVHYGDWRRSDEKFCWSPSSESAPTMVQILEYERQQQARLQRSAEQADRAAATAATIWHLSPAAQQHGYLDAKGIPPFFLRVLTPEAAETAPQWVRDWINDHALIGSLIVPVGRAGQLVSLQFIRADNEKKYLPKGTTKAGRCFLGKLEGAKVIGVSEGFATGASAHLATGFPTAIAFHADNIADVVAGLRRDYPAAVIVIFADNDLRPKDSILQNTGVIKARSAALQHGCKVAIPELNGKKCDWNDVFLEKGAEAVRQAIEAALHDQPVDPVQPALSAHDATIKLQDTVDSFLDAVGTPAQKDVCVRGAAGLGKSTLTAGKIEQRHVNADFFVPSHAVAAEQAARLPAGTAIAIRGRTHQAPDSPPLCAKHEAATLLAKAGLAHMTAPLLCGKLNQQTGQLPCPYARKCGYLNQFKDTAPIRFYAHEWLTLPESKLSKASGRKPAIAVIDESFRDALEEYRSWPIAELYNQPEAIYRKLAEAIRENRLIAMTDCLPEIESLLEQHVTAIAVHPEMDAAQSARVLQSFAHQRRQPIAFLRRCKEAIEQGAVNALWYVGQGIEGRVHSARTKPIQFIKAGVPKLFLDASAAELVVKKVSPDCEIVDIPVQRNVEMTQITDSAMSYHRLREDNAHLSSRVIELAYRLSNEGGKGALIAPKFWLDQHGARLPTGTVTAHYGALRGLNELEHCDWLIQLSRCEPPPYAVEEAVRAWFPTEPIKGAALQEQVELRDKRGYGAIVKRTSHADPRCAELLQSVREQESLQAIDRLRLVHHTGKPKRVFLLSSLPLPGAVPDQLTTFDKLTLPGRLAEVMIRDGALILNRSFLAAKHPDLFPSAEDARKAVADWRDNLNGTFSYIDTYRETYHSSTATGLTLATYRTVKQTGGKPRQAILYGNLEAGTVLTRLHGETVQIKGTRLLEPEAAPLSAPEPVKILPEPAPPELRIENVAVPIEPAAMEDQTEIRAMVWRIYLEDGGTAVLRDPDRPTLPDAFMLARQLMSGVNRVEAA